MLARLEPLLKFARQDVDSADTFVSAYTVNLLAVITRPSPCNSSDAPALPHLLMPRVNECYCMRTNNGSTNNDCKELWHQFVRGDVSRHGYRR